MPTTDEDLARARLAYISAGRRPLSAPRRAAADERPAALPDSAETDGPADDGDPASPLGGSARVLPPALLDPALRRRYVAVVLVLLLIGVGITVLLLGRSEASQVPLEPEAVEVVTEPAPSLTASPEPVLIRIHVLGSVRWPGVVSLEDGAIVADALEAAGGLTPEADPAELNLASALVDGQQIIVGTTSEPRGELKDQSDGGEDGTAAGGLVNVNTASSAALETLPGVGPVLAAAIIAWRDEHDGFRTVSDLQEVPGIGPKTFAILEPLVTV